jgi:hypothetical protein
VFGEGNGYVGVGAEEEEVQGEILEDIAAS